jgi:hypothetical protein
LNIGVLVDGDSEVQSLPQIRNALEAASTNRLMAPVLLRTTPLAPLPTLAAECFRSAQMLGKRGAHLVIVLVDREMREECPPTFAQQLSKEIGLRGSANVPINIVVKDRTFENWLISDPSAVTI